MLGDEFLEMSVIQSEEDNDEELTDEEKEAKKRKLAIENGYDMEKSFASKSVWARIAVIAAGPVFNFLLAFVCAVVIVGSLMIHVILTLLKIIHQLQKQGFRKAMS